MAERNETVDVLAGFALFADLPRAQLEGVAHTLDEEVFADGQRVLRQGFTGSGFYVIVEGEAHVRVDGVDRATLRRGDFFGEVSVLLDEPPIADIVASGVMRCLVLPASQVHGFLLAHPQVMFRMLQAMARRLRAATMWAG